jgi:DnaJ-class molecular chaperone
MCKQHQHNNKQTQCHACHGRGYIKICERGTLIVERRTCYVCHGSGKAPQNDD